MMQNDKEQLLRKLNAAFAKSDVDTILDCVTSDIEWILVGDKTIKGKDDFANALQEMASPEPMEFEIDHLISDGETAAVDGTISTPDGKSFSFCDIYFFNGSEEAKIKSMRSYVIELAVNTG